MELREVETRNHGTTDAGGHGGLSGGLQQRTLRLYGVFLLASGLAKLAQTQLPGYEAIAPGVMAAVAAAAAMAGAVLIVATQRRALPWWAAAVPAGLGLALVGYGLPHVAVPPDRWLTAAVLFVGIFVLLGLTQRQRVVAAFVPLVAAVHVLPYAPDAGAVYAAAVTGVMVVALCGLVGLLLSHTVGGLESARAASTTRAQALERLSGTPARIARADPAQAAEVTGEIAREVFGAEAVWVTTDRSDVHVPAPFPSPLSDPFADVGEWQPTGDELLAVVAEALSTRQPATADGGDGQWLVAIPLLSGDRIQGSVVWATTADAPLTPVERRCAELFAHQAGTALEQHDHHQQLRHTAAHDPLTGVGNRRHADWLLDSLEVGDTVCLLDLDKFKHANDTHGHCVGDAILAGIGAHLRASLRDPDQVARYGGDEFLAVLRDVDAARAADITARLHSEWADPTGCGVTFSLGTATHTADASPEHTLSVADTALYSAKDQRRTTAADPSDQAGAKPQRRSLATVLGTVADPATEPASTRGDHEVAV